MTPMTDDMQVTDAETEAAPTVEAMATEATANVQPEVAGADPVAVQAIADRELKAIVESLLFVSPDPLSVQRLMAVIGDVKKADIDRVLRSLGEDLEQEGRGIRLAEIAGGYRLVTKQEYSAWIKRLDKTKSTAKLSRSALESLAIIAYKQPIVKSEIEEIRGVETSGVVRTLLERKLVRIVGRKEVPGRPIMYGTTKYFLEHFGLNDLSQLPPLREFKELGESDQSLLPMGDVEIQAPEISAETADLAEGTEAELSLAGPIEAVAPEGESDDAVPVSGDEALLGETVEQA
ncbi:MAG: SMC-Scp complex subunit ScpB [Nitrospira sp.]